MGKLSIFVTTEEVKIKKEKKENIECPIAQLSKKEEQDIESDKRNTDLSLTQGSSAGQGEDKLIEMMNNETTEPSLSDTETSGTKDEMKNESNTAKESEKDGKESDGQEISSKMEGKESGTESNGQDSDKGNKGKESADKNDVKGSETESE